jgi:hypothetical protein
MTDRKVRVLVGTRKGGYIAESDTSRRRWKVRGPIQPGSDVFHMVADPRRPGDLYAAVNSGWWGPTAFRSRDWGHKWQEIPPPEMPGLKDRHPEPPDGMGKTPVRNIWHIEPGPENEPNTIFLGIDPASLWRSDDRGSTWQSMKGLNEHPTRPEWVPGAGGMCLHTILIDPGNPRRMYVGISAAGVFRSDDGGERWTPYNAGVPAGFLPKESQYPEFGQCVHKVAIDPKDPSTLYRQDHDGMFVSHDAAEHWKRIGRPLGDDFGFVVAAPPHRPGEAYFIPIISGSRLTPDGHLQIYRWKDRPRKWERMVRPGQFPGDFGMHREGLAVDALDPGGIYFGSTTGHVVWSADDGHRWGQIPFAFPGIQSVSVASPEPTR